MVAFAVVILAAAQVSESARDDVPKPADGPTRAIETKSMVSGPTGPGDRREEVAISTNKQAPEIARANKFSGDLDVAAGEKKYKLVKKKPKMKKIKMEVYEPKMKYKKIKMKVPVKKMKKKKVKGYMVKKHHEHHY